VEANKFLRLLLPKLRGADPSLDTEDPFEELLEPEEVLRSPNCGIPGVALLSLGEVSRPYPS